MTEQEAKTKWCPWVRFHVAYNGNVYDNKPLTEDNKFGKANTGSTFCIASDCAMWVPDFKHDSPSLTNYGHCGLINK